MALKPNFGEFFHFSILLLCLSFKPTNVSNLRCLGMNPDLLGGRGPHQALNFPLRWATVRKNSSCPLFPPPQMLIPKWKSGEDKSTCYKLSKLCYCFVSVLLFIRRRRKSLAAGSPVTGLRLFLATLKTLFAFTPEPSKFLRPPS